MALSADDIKIGSWISVTQIIDIPHDPTSPIQIGSPLRVVAVHLPFIAVASFTSTGEKGPFVLLFNGYRFALMSKTFVRQIRAYIKANRFTPTPIANHPPVPFPAGFGGHFLLKPPPGQSPRDEPPSPPPPPSVSAP